MRIDRVSLSLWSPPYISWEMASRKSAELKFESAIGAAAAAGLG